MAYTITLTNGTVLTTIADTTVDNTTSLTLLGRNFAGYGGIVAEDFVFLLENFAFSVAPANPLVGQLWYNSTTLALEVWNGTSWSNVGFSTVNNNTTLVFDNPANPPNLRKWQILVSGSSPYIGMLVFQALNDDGSVKNTVMALDGVNNLILGAATYS